MFLLLEIGILYPKDINNIKSNDDTNNSFKNLFIYVSNLGSILYIIYNIRNVNSHYLFIHIHYYERNVLGTFVVSSMILVISILLWLIILVYLLPPNLAKYKYYTT